MAFGAVVLCAAKMLSGRKSVRRAFGYLLIDGQSGAIGLIFASANQTALQYDNGVIMKNPFQSPTTFVSRHKKLVDRVHTYGTKIFIQFGYGRGCVDFPAWIPGYGIVPSDCPSRWDSSAQHRAMTKTVVPIAGPKGYGLAVMIEAFAALLAGANYGASIGVPNKGEHENTGFAMILVDVEKFMPVETFKANVDAYIRSIKGSRKAEGVQEILTPGELEYKRYQQYMRDGYDVSEALGKELAGYAVQFGLAPEGTDFETFVRGL